MAGESVRRRFARWKLPARSGQSHHEWTEGVSLPAYFQWTVLRIRLPFGVAKGESLDSGGDRSSSPVAKFSCVCSRRRATRKIAPRYRRQPAVDGSATFPGRSRHLVQHPQHPKNIGYLVHETLE